MLSPWGMHRGTCFKVQMAPKQVLDVVAWPKKVPEGNMIDYNIQISTCGGTLSTDVHRGLLRPDKGRTVWSSSK